MVKSLETTE